MTDRLRLLERSLSRTADMHLSSSHELGIEYHPSMTLALQKPDMAFVNVEKYGGLHAVYRSTRKEYRFGSFKTLHSESCLVAIAGRESHRASSRA